MPVSRESGGVLLTRESVKVPEVVGLPGKERLIEFALTEPVSGTDRPPSGSTN